MMDDRAQSQVLGAALIFGFLVLLLGIYQVFGVPQQNEEVEFKHNQEVQGELQDLRGDIQAASVGVDGSESIKLGTQYPTRFIALNPPAPAGSLRTDGTDNPAVGITIENAEATDPETADFWDGTPQDFETGSIRYSPAYTRYDAAPDTAIENSVIYNDFDDGTVLAGSGQQLVDGRQISLVALDGDLSTTRSGTLTVDTEPISASTTSIGVANQGGTLTVTIATKLSGETWVDELLRDQIDHNGGPPPDGASCNDVDPGGTPGNDRFIKNCQFDSGPAGPYNELTLEFEDGVVYDLSLSKVGVGTGTTGTSAKYITDTQGDGTSVPQDGRQKIVFDVRDAFNNPPSGTETVKVALEDPNDGELVFEGTRADEFTDISVGEDGKVELFYEAPSTTSTSPKPITINATFTDSYDPNPEVAADTASIDLRVINASKINRASPLINPPGGLIVTDATCDTITGGGATPPHDEVVITFESDDSTIITDMRYAFYSPDSAGVSANPEFEEMELLSPGSQVFQLSGGYEDTAISVDSSGSRGVRVEFKDDTGTPHDMTPGDFFVIETIDEDVRQTFFIAPSGC